MDYCPVEKFEGLKCALSQVDDIGHGGEVVHGDDDPPDNSVNYFDLGHLNKISDE